MVTWFPPDWISHWSLYLHSSLWSLCSQPCSLCRAMAAKSRVDTTCVQALDPCVLSTHEEGGFPRRKSNPEPAV